MGGRVESEGGGVGEWGSWVRECVGEGVREWGSGGVGETGRGGKWGSEGGVAGVVHNPPSRGCGSTRATFAALSGRWGCLLIAH